MAINHYSCEYLMLHAYNTNILDTGVISQFVISVLKPQQKTISHKVKALLKTSSL